MFDQHIEILFNREINSGIFLMGLRSPEIAGESRPGQFVMVRVNEGIAPMLRRPFSICSVYDVNTICILYRIIGHGTELMAGKKAGEKLSILGPLGQGFILPRDNENAVLVAGGIGAAPLYFLAGEIKNHHMEFMAGFGSSRDIIPVEKIIEKPIGISVATDDGSTGYAGMVTGLLAERLDQIRKDAGSTTIYTCGPLPMMKKVASIASGRGIKCYVSMEALMACGLGACQGCAIKAASADGETCYHSVCKDGPVFPYQVIDWSNI